MIFVSQTPIIRIVNGEASGVNGPQPAYLKVRGEGREELVAVLDTHDQIKIS